MSSFYHCDRCGEIGAGYNFDFIDGVIYHKAPCNFMAREVCDSNVSMVVLSNKMYELESKLALTTAGASSAR